MKPSFLSLLVGVPVALLAQSSVAAEPPTSLPAPDAVNSRVHVRVAPAREPGREGTFLENLRFDVQCDSNFSKLCCQLTPEGCDELDGGPFYAPDDIFEQDIFVLNQYWDEFIPENLPFEECESYDVKLTTALHPGPGWFFYYNRNYPVFYDVCDLRGQMATFCIGTSTLANERLAGHVVPWGFGVETLLSPFDKAVDPAGLDMTATEACTE